VTVLFEYGTLLRSLSFIPFLKCSDFVSELQRPLLFLKRNISLVAVFQVTPDIFLMTATIWIIILVVAITIMYAIVHHDIYDQPAGICVYMIII